MPSLRALGGSSRPGCPHGHVEAQELDNQSLMPYQREEIPVPGRVIGRRSARTRRTPKEAEWIETKHDDADLRESSPGDLAQDVVRSAA